LLQELALRFTCAYSLDWRVFCVEPVEPVSGRHPSLRVHGVSSLACTTDDDFGHGSNSQHLYVRTQLRSRMPRRVRRSHRVASLYGRALIAILTERATSVTVSWTCRSSPSARTGSCVSLGNCYFFVAYAQPPEPDFSRRRRTRVGECSPQLDRKCIRSAISLRM
jgi:hypothetical protein